MDTGVNLTPSMKWDIPRISRDPLPISVQSGDRLFIVGPNGTGKSALNSTLVSGEKRQNIRRISAHRQTWLGSGSLNLTPLSRKEFEEQNTSLEREYGALWQEYNAEQKQAAVLFDLVAKENTRARSITSFVDSKNLEEASRLADESVSAFVQLNELLSLGTLKITLRIQRTRRYWRGTEMQILPTASLKCRMANGMRQ